MSILLKTHEDRLVALSNARYVQRRMKLCSAGMQGRDALAKVSRRSLTTS